MELALVLLILKIASGFCIHLQSLESYLGNNTELQINDKSEQRSVKETNDNPEHVNPGRRIFKVLPVKPNKKWNTKYQDQPDNRRLTEEIPIAIIVAAKHNLDDAKLNTEFVNPLQKSEEVKNIKINQTQHLKHNISPSSTLSTAKSGTEISNDVEPKILVQVPESIVTRKSMHNDKDLKENPIELEDITFKNINNKYLSDINDDTMMMTKHDITDKEEIVIISNEHYDDKIIQIEHDENIKSEEKIPTELKTKGDLNHEIETIFFKPTTDNKKELNGVIQECLDESKFSDDPKPQKGLTHKDFNLFFIFNK